MPIYTMSHIRHGECYLCFMLDKELYDGACEDCYHSTIGKLRSVGTPTANAAAYQLRERLAAEQKYRLEFPIPPGRKHSPKED